MKTNLDFSIGFRNGVGIDLAALPKQGGVAREVDSQDYKIIEINMLQLLLPFLYIQFGTVSSESIGRIAAEELVNEDIRRFKDGD